MDNTKRTQTPWTWETYDGDDRVFIHAGKTETGLESKPIILRGPDKITNVERAALIVRAVNAYEPMREALGMLFETLIPNSLCPFGLAYEKSGPLDQSHDHECQCNYHEAVRQARAALALAEKE